MTDNERPPQIAKLQIFSEDRPWEDTVNIFIVGEDGQGRKFRAKPTHLVFEVHEPHLVSPPTFEFSGPIAREFFPAFHDAMVRSGYLKPKRDESIEAVKHHLEDMRTLVFDFMKRGTP